MDRTDQLGTQGSPGFIFTLGIGLPGSVRKDRDHGGGKGCRRQRLFKRLARVFNQMTVKRGCHGQFNGPEFHFPAGFLGNFNPFGRTGQDTLGRTVAVGQDHVGLEGSQKRVNFFQRGFHGQHGSAFPAVVVTGGRHETTTVGRQAEEGLFVQPPGGIEGGQFTIAVTGCCIGCYVETFQYFQHAEAGGPNGRLGRIGPAQVLFLLGGFRAIGSRPWKDQLTQRGAVDVNMIGGFEGRVGLGKTTGQIAGHIHILAALTGKQECQLAFFRCAAEVDVSGLPLGLVAIIIKGL